MRLIKNVYIFGSEKNSIKGVTQKMEWKKSWDYQINFPDFSRQKLRNRLKIQTFPDFSRLFQKMQKNADFSRLFRSLRTLFYALGQANLIT